MQSEDFFRKLWETVGNELATEKKLSVHDVRTSMERMKAPFREGRNCSEFMDIDFESVDNCVAYARRVGTCHSLITELATNQFLGVLPCSLKDSLLNESCIHVVSIGGGPGSDLMGFYYALRRKWDEWTTPGSILQVSGTIYDYFSKWEDIVDKLRDVASRKEFIELERNAIFDIDFARVDLTEDTDDSSESLDAIHRADVILMVKVLSILSRDDGTALLKNILSRIKKPSAVLIVVDTRSKLLLETLAKYANYEVILGPTDRTTIRTGLPWQTFVRESSYETCIIRHRGRESLSPM